MGQKISIVIPVFNRINTICEAINSVINQSYGNWELFVIDDGSTDNTKELIITEYTKNHRINLVERPENRPKGANACRNIGLEKASGKYIAFLDSDDRWKKRHLEDCLQLTEGKGVFHGCYSGAIIKKGKYSLKKESRELNKKESHFDFLINGGFAQTSSYFVNRQSALEVKFDESLQRHQDWDFFVRFGRKFPWTFNEKVNVLVYWPFSNLNRKIDFKSCISFYENHKESISNKNLKNEYLYMMLKKAIVKKDLYAINYYKRIISDEKKKALPIKYPFFYRFLLRTKFYLKIPQLKLIIKSSAK